MQCDQNGFALGSPDAFHESPKIDDAHEDNTKSDIA